MIFSIYLMDIREDQNNKNVSIRALPYFGGGGLPFPEFFCTVFLISKSLVKVSKMVTSWVNVRKSQ